MPAKPENPSASEWGKWRPLRVALLVACASMVLVIALRFAKSDYLRFMEDRNEGYYSNFAHACDILLAQRSLGTNMFLRLAPGDESVPKIIRDLHVTGLTVFSNSVGMRTGIGRSGFGVSWGPDEAMTNSWVLKTYAEGLERVAYIEHK